jgi:hypothetical protein
MVRNHMKQQFAVSVVVACATAGSWAATRGPDTAGYIASDVAVFSFVDIAGSSGGASLLSGTDDGTATLAIPFLFEFYGHNYSFVCVSTNGAMYFVANGGTCSTMANDFANIDITAAAVPGDLPAILPFWSDLTFHVPGAGALFYQSLGTVGTRRFVVQWNNVYPQGSPNPVTFQVILSEGTNEIAFQYKKVGLGGGNPATNGAQATVGIRNANALQSQQQIPWSFSVPVIADSTAIVFSGDTAPPVITAAASPSSLWPPNGKVVRVTVSGSITDTKGVDRSSGTYTVEDSFGQADASGTFSIAQDGTYAFTVGLMASNHPPKRASKTKDDKNKGEDRGGGKPTTRTYTITVAAKDTAGTAANKAVTVTVPTNPAVITVAARPSSLWPPNGKVVRVTVSGSITDTKGVDRSSGTYTVEDSFGQADASGTFRIAQDGTYTFTVGLTASNHPPKRASKSKDDKNKGEDRGGGKPTTRTYTITVAAKDTAGTAVNKAVTVTVPTNGR